MKSMSCEQLGGACSIVFQANTFEEIAELSKAHGMEMFKKGDPPHLAAMKEMKKIMQSPNEMATWFESKRKEFEALPED